MLYYVDTQVSTYVKLFWNIDIIISYNKQEPREIFNIIKYNITKINVNTI